MNHTLYFLVSYLQIKRNKKCFDVKLSNTCSCYLSTEEMFCYTAIIFHLINVAFYVNGQNCNDFTVGSCADNDNLIWENDQVENRYLGGLIITDYTQIESTDLCQDVCHSFTHCEFFNFYQGTCKLYR